MYNVEIQSLGDYKFSVKSGDNEILVDAKGAGIGPLPVLLASLGTCVGVYLTKYAEGTKLDLGKFHISVSADLCKDKPIRFRDIDVKIDMGETKLEQDRKEALMRFVKNCPVHNTVKSEPNISMEIK